MGGVEQALCSSTPGAHARSLPQTGAVLGRTGADVLLVEVKSRESSGSFVLVVEERFTP